MRRSRSLLVAATTMWVLAFGAMPAHAAGSAANTFGVQLDAQPPTGEPWSFLRIFPHALNVHQGDVIDAGWNGTDTPHTATLVNTPDPEGWRAQNQCDGCPWAPFEPDALAGGDDNEVVITPGVLAPTSFTCGTSGNPCSFDGSAVVSSGINFPNPGAQPSFFLQVNAAPGSYSLLCLLHPGMEIPVVVRPPDKPVATPAQVAGRLQREASKAVQVDGSQADAQAQEVSTHGIGGGRIAWTINAGGFSNGATANEYIGSGLSIHVGDTVTVTGNDEIHTATVPLSSVNTTPFIVGQCEVPGTDPPANSPADCADPSQFRLALNNRALLPSKSNALLDPNRYRNSGLLAGPGQSFTFVAKAPGTYSMVCLVHGPEMNTTITVQG